MEKYYFVFLYSFCFPYLGAFVAFIRKDDLAISEE